MATVKLTLNLKDAIINNIQNSYNERAKVPIDALSKMDLGTEVYRLTFKENEVLLAQQLNNMSSEIWVPAATTVMVEIKYPSAVKEDTEYSRAISYKLPMPMIAPMRRLRNGYITELRLELPPHAPSYEAVIKLLQEHEAIGEECRQTVKTIERDILNKCATLKQLLEVWPNAVEYIPEYAKERHNLKVTAKKTPPTEIVISDEIKASLIKTRMLTSGG